MRLFASSPSVQTGGSGRIAGLAEDGNVGLKRPAEQGAVSGSGSAKRKVDDQDERGEIPEFLILISTSDYAQDDDTSLEVVIPTQATVEDDKDIIERAAELRTPGTTSPGDRVVRPTVTISWAKFVKLPCASFEDYRDRDRSSCAVPAPEPGRAIDVMVKPKGPTMQSTIHPRATPTQKQKHIERFDLTSDSARGAEPANKRQRVDNGLGFPYRLGSQETVTGTYERNNFGAPINGPRSAASSVNPEGRPGDILTGLQTGKEFRIVEKMMRSNSGRRRQSQHDSRGTSRENSHQISDDDCDPILDDGPGVSQQPKQQPGLYMGTAGLRPPRTKEQKAAAAKSMNRVILPDVSPYFQQQEGQSFTGAQRPMVGGGNAASTPRMKDRMQNGIGNKRHSDDFEDIDDNESAKKPRRGSQAGQMHSGSLSQTGDIPSSFPTKSPSMFKMASETARERAQETFQVDMVKTAYDCYMTRKEEGPASFSWRQDNRALLLSRNEHELNPTLAIGMNKIQKITCSNSPQYDGLFFIRQLDPYPKLMLVRLSAVEEAEEFLKYLQKISPGLKAPLRYPSQEMDRVFKNTSKRMDEFHYQLNKNMIAQHEIPADIRLLESRKSASSQEHQPQSQGTEQTPIPRKTLANSMIPESKPTRGSTCDRDRPRISPSAEMDRPATRSTRSQQIELHRSPSPRLELWTKANRRWRDKYWKGDEPLIYPEAGDRRATVDRQDIERLNEGEFLNDNLLQFYLRYLEEKIKTENPDVAKRVLFMNPFFYQRLTKGKGKSHIDYDGVKRWTSKLDIFSYDYIIVPVNEYAHWYLAVICNTPAFLKQPQEEEVKAEENDMSEADTSLLEVGPPCATAEQKAEVESTTDVEEKVNNMSIDDKNTIVLVEDETATRGPVVSPKQKKKKRKSSGAPKKYKTHEPRIVTMDSLGFPHSPTCTNLKAFIVAEAKARKGVDVDVALQKGPVGMTAKNIPEQDNHCDCGLFLLGYVEYFLENPDGMMHDLMQQKPEVAARFAKLDAHGMRASIRELLFELKKEQTEREQAEKDARIAKRRAEKASEGSDSLPPTTEPTPAASPERSGTTSSDEQKTAAPEQSRKSSTEPAEEESLIEVEDPAASADNMKERSASSESDFMDLIDSLTGYRKQNQEPPRQHLPTAESLEAVGDRPRTSPPLQLPPDVKEHHLSASKSVEYVGTQERSSPLDDEAAFTARNALVMGSRRRNAESLTSNSDGESEPEITSVKKKNPPKNVSMSPVPAPSPFDRPGHKVGKIGPPRARNPSSDLDAPQKQSVVDVDEEGDDLPSQPTSRELRRRPKESLPLTQQHTPSRKPMNNAKKTPGNCKEDDAVELLVKKFTPPKPRLSERVAVKRSQTQTQTPNKLGGQHTKFEDNEDVEMLMNGEREDSLMRDMSPETLRSSATKIPAVEITPGKSQVDFDVDLPVNINSVGTNLPLRNSTPPPTKSNSTSSPAEGVRSSPRNVRKVSIMGNDSVMRSEPIYPQSKKSSVAGSSPSQNRSRTLPPTTKVYTPSGSSRRSVRAPDEGKKGKPIELD